MEYTLAQDFQGSFKNASLGPNAPSIPVQFNAGQKITGVSYDNGQTIVTDTTGNYDPRKLGGVNVTIPAAYLTATGAQPAPGNVSAAPMASTASVATSSYVPDLNIYTAGGAFLGLGLGYGMYSLAKKESWLTLAGYCFGGAAFGILVGTGTSKLVSAIKGTVNTK